jgi:hypothetical protein
MEWERQAMNGLEGSTAQKRWYVYTLEKPTGEVFYVGMGTNNRLNQHEMEARSGIKSRKCDTIREIWAQRQQIVKRVIYEISEREDAKLFEQECIQFTYAGPHLTNIVGNMYELTRRRKERYEEESRRCTERSQAYERKHGLPSTVYYDKFAEKPDFLEL